MPTPIPIETFTTKQNLIDVYDASHINTLQTSIVTLETALTNLINTDGSLRQGTSFPSSPVTGQLFYRTDLGQVYIYSGSGWAAVSAISNIQLFTASGTFTAPTGITKVYVSMCGGGGGGAGGRGGGAGTGDQPGGASAANSLVWFPVTVIPGNNYTVTIGAAGNGGTGGTGGAGTDGTDGGNTSFDTLTCLGGKKGTTTAAGANTSFTRNAHATNGTGGNNQELGGDGGRGTFNSNGGGGGACPFGAGGNGASSTAPTGYGAGGYSGIGQNANPGGNGSAGTPGVCIVAY